MRLMPFLMYPCRCSSSWLGWLWKEMWSAKSGFCATGLSSSPFTARTRSLCQLLRLDRTAFLRIVQSNVGDGTIIMNNLIQYLKEKKDISVIAGVTKEIEYMLARGQLELPITLCFAASKGDDFLLRQLLKRGLDPNELDNYGRTTLIWLGMISNQMMRHLMKYGGGELVMLRTPKKTLMYETPCILIMVMKIV